MKKRLLLLVLLLIGMDIMPAGNFDYRQVRDCLVAFKGGLFETDEGLDEEFDHFRRLALQAINAGQTDGMLQVLQEAGIDARDLVDAVQVEDTGTVKLFLGLGIDPHYMDDHGQLYSLLTDALSFKALEVAQVIIEHGSVCPYMISHEGKRPLEIALLKTDDIFNCGDEELGQYRLVFSLLEQYEREHGEEGGCEHCQHRFMVKKEDKENILSRSSGSASRKPQKVAVQVKDSSGRVAWLSHTIHEFLQLIQQSGGICWRQYNRKDLIPAATTIVTPDTVMTTDEEGNSLLFWAASTGDACSLASLLECMDDSQEAQTLRGKALLRAVRKNYVDCAELLLARPVDTTVRERGHDLFRLGVDMGVVAVVEEIINSKQACPFVKEEEGCFSRLEGKYSPREKALQHTGNRRWSSDYRRKCSQIADMLGQYEQEHQDAGGCEHCKGQS